MDRKFICMIGKNNDSQFKKVYGTFDSISAMQEWLNLNQELWSSGQYWMEIYEVEYPCKIEDGV